VTLSKLTFKVKPGTSDKSCFLLIKEDVKIILVMVKSTSGKQPPIDVQVEEFGFFQLSTGNLFQNTISLFFERDMVK
jgi:hypothetical protein